MRLQEWKEIDPPALTVGRLTEIPTGDLLHLVSEEPAHNVLLEKKKLFSYFVHTFFASFQLVLTRRPRPVLELLLNSSL